MPDLPETIWAQLRSSVATVAALNILPAEIVTEATGNEIVPINLVESHPFIKIPHGFINKNFTIKLDRYFFIL